MPILLQGLIFRIVHGPPPGNPKQDLIFRLLFTVGLLWKAIQTVTLTISSLSGVFKPSSVHSGWCFCIFPVTWPLQLIPKSKCVWKFRSPSPPQQNHRFWNTIVTNYLTLLGTDLIAESQSPETNQPVESRGNITLRVNVKGSKFLLCLQDIVQPRWPSPPLASRLGGQSQSN